jgi:hypothetical protein
MKKDDKLCFILQSVQGRRGLDRMIVGFTTTYAISARHKAHFRAGSETSFKLKQKAHYIYHMFMF